MTICNVWMASNRAVVAVDSMTAFGNGGSRECSKLSFVPHLNLIVTGRGLGGLAPRVADTVRRFARTFDAAVELVEQDLPGIVAEFEAEEAALPERPEPESSIRSPQDVLLIGWSPRMSRMVSIALTSDGVEPGFTRRELRSGALAPFGAPLAGDFPPGWVPK